MVWETRSICYRINRDIGAGGEEREKRRDQYGLMLDKGWIMEG